MYLTYNYPYSYLSHQDEDLDRTVGINTCYVGTSDFELEEADKDYVISVSWFLYHSCVTIVVVLFYFPAHTLRYYKLLTSTIGKF